jgi:hypothetical protein
MLIKDSGAGGTGNKLSFIAIINKSNKTIH